MSTRSRDADHPLFRQAELAYDMAPPIRLSILTELRRHGDLDVGSLLGKMPGKEVLPATMSANLRKLVDGGILTFERQKQHRVYSIRKEAQEAVAGYLLAVRLLGEVRDQFGITE